MIYVFGGMSSGKSRIAEELALGLQGERIYLATMENTSDASRERIKKHRQMRAGKGFVTIEKEKHLSKLFLYNKVVLLECVSNLLANTMFDGKDVHGIQYCVETVMADILHVSKENELLVVGNDVFGTDFVSETPYDSLTKQYIQALYEIHTQLLFHSKRYIEVVCGIQIERKSM